MNNCPDQRGQAVQVGAIVILGFVVLAISIFQAQGVPQETVETEVEHNQEVADQLEALSMSLAETNATGSPETTTVTLGTTYGDRPLFVYPPPTAGSLETTEPRKVEIKNTTTDEDAPFHEYWNQTQDETRDYNTSSILYDIDYRELRGTPNVTLEYGIFEPEFENQTLPEKHGQPLVDGTDISLVVYDGELAERSTTTESVVVERVTNPTTVNITENSSAGPITLTVPTELNEDTWNETLDPENESSINESTHDGETLSLELNSSEEPYQLTINKVDVGPNATEPDPVYLHEDGDDITARTKFNDPVDAWAFDDDNRIRIPSEGIDKEDDPDGTCLSLTEDPKSYQQIDLEDGGCSS